MEARRDRFADLGGGFSHGLDVAQHPFWIVEPLKGVSSPTCIGVFLTRADKICLGIRPGSSDLALYFSAPA